MRFEPVMSNAVSIEAQSDIWGCYLKNLLLFLHLYQDILDSYVLDFYSKQLWDHFPLSWRSFFEDFSPVELAQFLSGEPFWKKSTKVIPLSLLAFKTTCTAFAIPRNPISGVKDLDELYHQSTGQCKQDKGRESAESPIHISESSWKSADKELSPEGGQHYLLAHIFRKHLKPKKQHEVLRMAQISSKISLTSGADVVIDVGSGQGHLARLISYGFNIPTICLEAEQNFVEEARKFDRQLEETQKSKLKYVLNPQEMMVGPHHEAFHLHPHVPHEEFSQMLSNVWPKLTLRTNVPENKSTSFSIVGLHCCGDLGPTLMRLFSSMASCRAVILVGCCYMKLTTDNQEKVKGYPMSEFVKSKKNHELSYSAREMACHAMESYISKLKKGADDLKVHSYRAVLEELIVRRNPELEHSGLRSVKNAHLLSFRSYAHKALGRLKEISFSEEELSTTDINQKLSDWIKVVIFYSIRLMMAPAVESLILLDRLYYLRENNTDSKCVIAPIFDPSLSPRNHALIATKGI